MRWAILLLLCLPSFARAFPYKESLRKCLLLPMRDYGLFQELEQYLKRATWCRYQHNSEILNILSSYDKNLDAHLANAEVLRVLAQKTRSGAIVRARAEKLPQKILLKLEVLASNGEDILYRKQAYFAHPAPGPELAQALIRWLERFRERIPYNGRVVEATGETFTLDVGESLSAQKGMQVLFSRPLRREVHPLLKEVVAFETRPLGQGVLTSVQEHHSQGTGPKEVQVGDWAQLTEAPLSFPQTPQAPMAPLSFAGQLGTVSLGMGIGLASMTQDGKTISGGAWGGNFSSELWITRHFWGGIDYWGHWAHYKADGPQEGFPSTKGRPGYLRGIVGYKYLPTGMFWGPQIDFYGGYKSLAYDLSCQAHESFEVSGMILGLRATTPLAERLRLSLLLDFALGASYKGQTDTAKASTYAFELAGKYKLSSITELQGFLHVHNGKISLPHPLSLQESVAGARVAFVF